MCPCDYYWFGGFAGRFRARFFDSVNWRRDDATFGVRLLQRTVAVCFGVWRRVCGFFVRSNSFGFKRFQAPEIDSNNKKKYENAW